MHRSRLLEQHKTGVTNNNSERHYVQYFALSLYFGLKGRKFSGFWINFFIQQSFIILPCLYPAKKEAIEKEEEKEKLEREKEEKARKEAEIQKAREEGMEEQNRKEMNRISKRILRLKSKTWKRIPTTQSTVRKIILTLQNW